MYIGVKENQRVDELVKKVKERRGRNAMQISIRKSEVKNLIWGKLTKCGKKGGI